MTTTSPVGLVGAGVTRRDGPQKAAGAAPYPSDFNLPNQAHGALVQSTIAAGRITSIDIDEALAAPGVLTVLTHENTPPVKQGPTTGLGASPPAPFRDNRVRHRGQHVAYVVAETPQQAAAAARLVKVSYETDEPILEVTDPRAEVLENPFGLDSERGDVEAALASADVKVEATYTTPDNTNNPLGLFATLASWDGDELLVHDCTQWPSMARTTFAHVFDVPEESVRVLVPFIGGAFGAGLRVWPHVILTILAARLVKRPVKLVLTRPQMFTSIGHRPYGTQQVALGATRAGKLVAIKHESLTSLSMDDDDYEALTFESAVGYACPNVLTRDRQARLNIPNPTSMRAPAEGQGNFGLESAMDELAYATAIDPLELRLRNYADLNPILNMPWSSKALRECYEVGAEKFGWHRRSPEPGSMREGNWLIGYGMAGATYEWYQLDCHARATIRSDGSAVVRSAATDLGTGTYTIMAQLSAETLGIALDDVRFELGDSDMPAAPQAGGSGLTGALGPAVHDACRNLIERFLDTTREDTGSPLRGLHIDDVTVQDGRIIPRNDETRGEPYADILRRHGLEELTADGESTPPKQDTLDMALSGAFGAKFVEVRVDADLRTIHVARVVSAIDGGRILNERTATSQIIGGTVGGIGMALFEETITDTPSGRIANATLGDYVVAVNADIPNMEVAFVGEPDRINPIGTKGVGEIGLSGVAAAIANAVYHATGKRVRSLPITIEDLL